MNKYVLLVGMILLWGACTQTTETTTAPAKDSTEAAQTTREPHRPLFHFTPPSKWMNDPNGLVFHDGEYHLFYQYYPDSTVWGPMHWGHAVSKDLVHWDHLPIALKPDSLGYIFSGSVVVDSNNTAGFGQQGQMPLVAIFTHHHPEKEKSGSKSFQYQSLAYSLDKGRTWTKYAGNPVLPNTRGIRDFRDPKVSWHPLFKQWIMVLAVADHVEFYASKDLKKWEYLSDFGKGYGSHEGVWECPDLFAMPHPMDKTKTVWVLLSSINPGGYNGGSGTQYFLGKFDGKRFTLDPALNPLVKNGKALWLDYGRDNYAGVTFNNLPSSPFRKVFMGWMSNWDYAQVVPTQSWRSAMTMPRELVLKPKPDGSLRLVSLPARETRMLTQRPVSIPVVPGPTTIDINKTVPGAGGAFAMEILADMEEDDDKGIRLTLSNAKGEKYVVGFVPKGKYYFSDRTQAGDHSFSDKFARAVHKAPRIHVEKTVKILLVFDVASCEMYGDNGEAMMTEIFFPSVPFDKVQFEIGDARTQMKRLDYFPIQP